MVPRMWLGSGLFALGAACFALFLHYRNSGALDSAIPALGLVDLRQSHIEVNVPAPEQFRALLTRDLEAYFHTAGAQPVRADYQLLRDLPTQSGVAHPKFYAWVRILCAGAPCREGAVRVAAIDKTRFEILHFAATADIARNPDGLASIFPAALIPLIQAKAGAPR